MKWCYLHPLLWEMIWHVPCITGTMVTKLGLAFKLPEFFCDSQKYIAFHILEVQLTSRGQTWRRTWKLWFPNSLGYLSWHPHLSKVHPSVIHRAPYFHTTGHCYIILQLTLYFSSLSAILYISPSLKKKKKKCRILSLQSSVQCLTRIKTK